jgi:hypothetical protein
MNIPRIPLILGLAGLIPFGFGAALSVFDASSAAQAFGIHILLQYGTVILAFMSGVLWGFSAQNQSWNIGYGLSVLPALWAFFAAFTEPHFHLLALGVGFLALLVLDWQFLRQGRTPSWWMRLRLILTTGVLLSFALGGLFSPSLGG